MSLLQRRLAIGVIGVHTPLAVVGTALSPYLAVHYPLVLVALAPELRGLGSGYWVEVAGPQTAAHRAFALWLAQECGVSVEGAN